MRAGPNIDACGHASVVEIDIDLRDAQVTMRACSCCDRRWWSSAGEELDLQAVLDLTAAKPVGATRL